MILSPPLEALDHQDRLLTHLDEMCQSKGGRLSFAEFMKIALYAPGLGYYSAGMKKLGKEGDFVTAPEISSLFSKTLGAQLKEILQKLNHPESAILELGAGSGRMAGDILLYLQTQNALPSHYYILEVSADLRDRQQHFLKNYCQAHFDKFVWLETLPENFTGIILGNEILDAMPVTLFKIEKDNEVLEGQVYKKSGQWQLGFYSHDNIAITKAVLELQAALPEPMPQGYTSEINLGLKPWLKSLSTTLKQGVILFIDYGFSQQEYYHPSRFMGTLMCHYRHRAHPDPFLNIGLQDITAHVDFSHVANAAAQVDLKLIGYTHQAAFLVSNGILHVVKASSTKEQIQLSQQMQLLLQPHEMGELFKVIAFSKNVDFSLKGFDLIDHADRL